MKKIAIIGAGFSGAYLAYQLKKHFEVTVFEKSRGVGGRMSTRYHEAFEFDHGTPSFKAKDSDFLKFLQQLSQKGKVLHWHNEHEFVSVPRMNSWIKYLLEGVEVHTNLLIEKPQFKEQQWDLGFHEEKFDILISTAPVEQTKALFDDSVSFYAKLNTLRIKPCFVLMLGLSDDTKLPNFSVITVNDGILDKIILNHSKPQRPYSQSIVVYVNSLWSQAHLEMDMPNLEKIILEQSMSYLSLLKSQILYSSLHRWRYAYGDSNLSSPLLLWDEHQHCGACGDWCYQGNVESAFLVANQFIKTLLAHRG